MQKDQRKTPLFDTVLEYVAEGVVPLHIPSHKQGIGIHPRWKEFAGENIFKMDLCEVHGLDDVHQASGVIKESQDLAADAWGADHSFFLVNGTSSGIIAAMTSTAGEGEKIIIPRNAHKSVVYALIISGAQPVYIPAEIHKDLGLVGGFKPEKIGKAFEKNPDAKGVFSVSPTYYGVCSNLKEIIRITHDNNAVMIADEAHGNHIYFHPDLPQGALSLEADASCQSTHKMSGSLTQSSLLHIKGNRMDIAKLKTNLQMMQNTSPSYLLQISLDMARSYIATEGKRILDNVIEMSSAARKQLAQIDGIEVLGPEVIGSHAIFDYDPIRLVISARKLGLEGYELYDILRSDYHIEIEFGDYFYAICVLGLGTTQEHLDRLIKAFQDISAKYKGQRKALKSDEELPPMPTQIMTPRQAYFAPTERIKWCEAKGRIAAEMIVPYPPGIPTICPGEVVTPEVWEFLDQQYRDGRHLHGPIDGKLDYFKVVNE